MSGPSHVFGSGSSGVREGGKGLPPSVRVASLCNLGNTCFLNSVLYTLRFTPGFSHSIHHLAADLCGSSSKGNSLNGTNSNSGGGKSPKGPPEVEVIERLHELFRSLKSADELEAREPVPPSSFLQSVSKLNPMFEGNRQQDAHELLMMILDMLQEIRVPPLDPPENGSLSGKLEPPEPKKGGYKRWKSSSSSSSSSTTPPPPAAKQAVGSSESSVVPQLPNFIKENFVGKAVMSTRCMECEMSTYRSEPFTNIDIALTFEDEEDLVGKELFLKKIMASETLKENNKYWCEECSRLNEAQRSVSYELLPKIMVLQLKRFTATGCKTYMSKINDYIPTPFAMDCFCTACNGKSPPSHHYRLYAVIMHLGGTLASGHYISYVRAAVQSPEYSECTRETTNGNNNNSGNGSSVQIKNIRNSKKPWIMKYFGKMNGNKSSSSSNSGPPPIFEAASERLNGGHSPFKSSQYLSPPNSSSAACRSYLCCGLKSLHLEGGHRGGDLGSSSESLDSSSNSANTFPPSEDYWLECDDENINAISRRQFEDILSAKQGATTPYLLFYQKY